MKLRSLDNFDITLDQGNNSFTCTLVPTAEFARLIANYHSAIGVEYVMSYDVDNDKVRLFPRVSKSHTFVTEVAIAHNQFNTTRHIGFGNLLPSKDQVGAVYAIYKSEVKNVMGLDAKQNPYGFISHDIFAPISFYSDRTLKCGLESALAKFIDSVVEHATKLDQAIGCLLRAYEINKSTANANQQKFDRVAELVNALLRGT